MATPRQWITWPHNGTVYLVEELCPEPRYSLLQNGVLLDLEAVTVQGGVLIEDPSLKAAKAARIAQERSDEQGKRARRALRAQALKDLDLSTASLAQLRTIVKELADDVAERG